MTEPNISRRKALATIGSIAGVTATAGCAGSVKNVLGGGKSKLQKQLDRVRKATEKYQDPEKAINDGYRPMGPYIDGMGWHFQNPQHIRDAIKNGFKIEKPQMVGYDNQYSLGYVEYVAPTKAVSGKTDIFANSGNSSLDKEQWKVHRAATHVYANTNGKQNPVNELSYKELLKVNNWAEEPTNEKSVSPGDTVKMDFGSGGKEERVVDYVIQHPDLTSLHAWIHTDNPNGVFAPANPNYNLE